VSPNGICFNPDDWTAIDTAKSSGSGEYIVVQPRGIDSSA
jgi:hypothetical protein